MSNSLWSHGILQARILEWVAVPFSRGIFPIQGMNPDLPHYEQILYQLIHKGSPRILQWVTYPFSSRSSQFRNWGLLHCSGFFTNWAIRKASRWIWREVFINKIEISISLLLNCNNELIMKDRRQKENGWQRMRMAR